MNDYRYLTEIYHHGILNQKWGVRNGPPYPLSGGQYSKSEKQAVYKERKKKNSIYNKKHFDKVISTDDKVSTLSYNKDRSKGADYIYATYKDRDKQQYKAMFNKPIDEVTVDENGSVKSNKVLKYNINHKVLNEIKVASEDSAAEVFRNLYSKDRDFYNFVTDDNRMKSMFVDSKYIYKGYREARDVIEKMKKSPDYVPTDKELQKVYRMFNYVIPNDGGGDARRAKDIQNQRNKFFKALEAEGYGALLDTNDAIYGSFNAEAPVIIFNMKNLVVEDAKRVSTADKAYSSLVTAGRKALNM